MKTKPIWFTLLATLLMMAFILSACGPAATPTQETAQPTEAQPQPQEQPTKQTDAWENVDPSGKTIIFWHQHTREREQALLEIVDEFNKTNEYGITVVAEYQGSYGDIFNKMLTFMNTPDAPELVVAYQN